MAQPTQPHYVAETQILRALAGDPRCRFRWTTHALVEMAKDGRNAQDIQDALTTCHVVLHEQKRDILWRAQCTDIDGDKFTVIVAINESEITIKIVTTF